MMSFDLICLMVCIVLAYMNTVFILALLLKRNDIVDIAWGLGFVVVMIILLMAIPGWHWRRLLISALVLIWGSRLAIYIHIRNKGKQEDFRYAKWRKDWGKYWVIRSYLQVFLTQGFFMLLVAYPLVLISNEHHKSIHFMDILGLIVWVCGFFFEAVGDAQLMSFKKNVANKGKIMNRGLWRYTRHPNYFGEACMWWGIFLLTLQVAQGWLALLSPVVMSFLLIRVSGVPMLERKYQDNPEYQDYINRTSSFFPLPPR